MSCISQLFYSLPAAGGFFLRVEPIMWFLLSQASCPRRCLDTVTLRPDSADTPRTNTGTLPPGTRGGAPLPLPTRAPEGTTPQDSVRSPPVTSCFLLRQRHPSDSAPSACDRVLHVHRGVAHAAGSERAAAVPSCPGNPGPSVSPVLLPHVRVGNREAAGARRQGRRGSVAMATERRAKHRLAESPTGIPEPESPSGETEINPVIVDLLRHIK